MKCDEEIPAYSSVTTNNVQIFAQGFYKGADNGEHWWMYRIEFKNVGKQRVQLLARHWVFVDSNGKTVEVKGPGARGLTPKISPGRTFKYESGTPLATSSGSMYGSFQFQVLRLQDGSKPETPIFFSARVGRLALTPDNTPAMVPCGEEASEGLVPLTSVWATDRVIVGVTSSYISPEEAEEVFGQTQDDAAAAGHKEQHTFLLDVQVDQRLCARARARAQIILSTYRHRSNSRAQTGSRALRCASVSRSCQHSSYFTHHTHCRLEFRLNRSTTGATKPLSSNVSTGRPGTTPPSESSKSLAWSSRCRAPR